MEQLERDPNYSEYHEPKVPFCFLWLFNCFIELYAHCGESVTWTDIQNYGNIRNIKFTQLEVDYILMMCMWSVEQKQAMKDEQE